MFRRRFTGGWGRRGTVVGGRRGFSFGTVVLLVSAAIILLLYLTGNLSL